jgi:hypothetical protein
MCDTNGPTQEELNKALTSYAVATAEILNLYEKPPTDKLRSAIVCLYEEARAWLADYYAGEVVNSDDEQYQDMLHEAAALLHAYEALGGNARELA